MPCLLSVCDIWILQSEYAILTARCPYQLCSMCGVWKRYTACEKQITCIRSNNILYYMLHSVIKTVSNCHHSCSLYFFVWWWGERLNAPPPSGHFNWQDSLFYCFLQLKLIKDSCLSISFPQVESKICQQSVLRMKTQPFKTYYSCLLLITI